MQEIWKPLIYNGVNYGNRYSISNIGRIKNVKTNQIRKNCLTDKNPYEYITFFVEKQTITVKIHRAVAENFIQNPNNLPQVNHKDGNKTNNCVDNLEWVTAKENCIHAVINDLFVKGEKSNWSKLTKEQIKYIKDNCVPGDKKYGCTALAKQFGIDTSTISKIIHDGSWKEYSDDYKLINNKVNKTGKEHNQSNNKPIKQSKIPPYDELLELIKTTSFVQIGKMYDVSDNAIRKWCKKYGLPYRREDIKNLLN